MDTTVAVSVPTETRPGASVLVEGRAGLVLHLLPRIEGRPLAARVTFEPPCRLCEAALQWDRAAQGWRCSGCGDAPTTAALAAWAAEHTRDGVRAGTTRRRRENKQRRRERWCRDLGLPADAVPRDADYHEAAQAGTWHRALTLARIALESPGLSPEARAAWRQRRDVARQAVERLEP